MINTLIYSITVFKNPTLSPNGTLDVVEGTNLTLFCDDPGNIDLPDIDDPTFYQWFHSTGSNLTNKVSTSPVNISFIDIQRQSSGLYICRSTKDIVPDITMSNVTNNVQCKLIFVLLAFLMSLFYLSS